jgi:hypothetical protein
MRNKLFVSNLSASLSEADLIEMFAAFRPLTVKIDRKKKSAVIEVAVDVLEDVVQKLDGTVVAGHELTVAFSVLIEPRAERGAPDDDLRPTVFKEEKPSKDGKAKKEAFANPFGAVLGLVHFERA